MTIADFVCVDLSTENADLREKLALYEWYRESMKAAIEQLHEQQRQVERQRRQIASLITENRALRGPTSEAA